MGFPGGSEVKVSACNVGDLGSIPGSGRFPWRRKWQPTPVLLPGKFHRQRSLVGYSPWDCKELDMTEQLHFHFNARLLRKMKSTHLGLPSSGHGFPSSLLDLVSWCPGLLY